MIRQLLAGLLFVAVTVSTIFALDEGKQAEPGAGKFALGGIAGDHPYIGGSVKYWFTDVLAIDGAVGFKSNLHMQANLTFNKKYFDFPKGDMLITIGGGLFTGFPVDFDFGIQAEGGVEWFMPWAPWGVFADYIPAINFFPDYDWVVQPFNFVVGARYYF